MKYCKKCLYPDTKPGLNFDDEGICNACINNERIKLIGINEKENLLKSLISIGVRMVQGMIV